MMSNARRRPLTADRGPIKSPRHRPRKRYGQHFLEPAWAEKLVKAIDPQPDDRFLEIGPGPGALTMRLAPRVAHLTAVEIDRDIVAALASQVPPNVEIVEGDFLEMDLGPLAKGGRLRVAGNLPYNISSPIMFRLLDAQATMPLVDATLMLQREVAERIEAGPGSRDYGVLSIMVAMGAEVRRVLSLPPGAFRPPPKVHSAVVRLSFRPAPVETRDRQVFDGMVRSIFTQRRKTLLNALRPFAAMRGVDAATALRQAGIDSRRRPETLDLVELARLAGIVTS
jgi:16S rRNA (adenine1518-N6/adenine1519-N6)-dimethyltransferase